ncbi:hypothetical protein [Pelagibius sp.]|uniref:hypothetical protein n=1 Tax=Pelagibius sp. TaxID=1931238 RepID=UPI003BAFC02B
MARFKRRGRFYALALGLAAAAGLAPAVLNLVVDPYNMNGLVDLDLNKQKVSEKAHYPLWKMARYPNEGAATVILGDSRARALREKYWRELGHEDVFNFAYGGATIQEVYDTFLFIRQNPSLKRLIIGIQLRSFDPDHKGGMNRVPEAVELTREPFDYYTSWFVAKVAWRNLQTRYATQMQELEGWFPRIISPAQAADYGAPGETPLSMLLGPDACYGCRLPDVTEPVVMPVFSKGPNLGLGRGHGPWSAIWTDSQVDRVLPPRFEHQVRKNGRSDWKSFTFSETLWSRIAEIADWSAANGVELVFVIPPTITEMQARMAGYGHGELNTGFRLRLAALAPVVDLDFDNGMTRDLSQFSDAYHFNAKVARRIVGELVQLVSNDPTSQSKARKRRGALRCPISPGDVAASLSDGMVTMSEGQHCRLWR